MNTIWESALYYVLVFGTALLATVFVVVATMSLVLAITRKRAAFLVLGLVFLILAGISVLANPIANLFMFNRVAERNTQRMIGQMQVECPVGTTDSDLISRCGQPARKRRIGDRQIWTYDANPWWMAGWTEIEVGIVSNKIDGHWLDD